MTDYIQTVEEESIASPETEERNNENKTQAIKGMDKQYNMASNETAVQTTRVMKNNNDTTEDVIQ